MTNPTPHTKPTPAEPSPSQRATMRQRIIRITVYLILGHALATFIAILLSIDQLNAHAPTGTINLPVGDRMVVVGYYRRALGIELATPAIHNDFQGPFNYSKWFPYWVQTELPGRGQPHIPDTILLTQISSIAIGVPMRMYRSTYAIWTDLSRQAPFQSHADTPFVCPVMHGTVHRSMNAATCTTHWGSIESRHITDPLPTFITNHLRLPPQLPITPIWTGTLINTLLFATLIALTHKATTTLRRHLNHRQNPTANPCKHCHYDLTGITQPVCPECGHAIPSPQSNPKSERQPPPQTDQ